MSSQPLWCCSCEKIILSTSLNLFINIFVSWSLFLASSSLFYFGQGLSHFLKHLTPFSFQLLSQFSSTLFILFLLCGSIIVFGVKPSKHSRNSSPFHLGPRDSDRGFTILDVCLFSILSPSSPPPCFTYCLSLSHNSSNSWTPKLWDPNNLAVLWPFWVIDNTILPPSSHDLSRQPV